MACHSASSTEHGRERFLLSLHEFVDVEALSLRGRSIVHAPSFGHSALRNASSFASASGVKAQFRGHKASWLTSQATRIDRFQLIPAGMTISDKKVANWSCGSLRCLRYDAISRSLGAGGPFGWVCHSPIHRAQHSAYAASACFSV